MSRCRILIEAAFAISATGLACTVWAATALAAPVASPAPGTLLPLRDNSLLFAVIIALVALLVTAGVVGLRRVRRHSPGGPADKKKVGRDR